MVSVLRKYTFCCWQWNKYLHYHRRKQTKQGIMSLVSKSSLLYEIKELPLCKYTLYGFYRLKVVLRTTVKGMAEDYKILNSPLPVCFFYSAP